MKGKRLIILLVLVIIVFMIPDVQTIFYSKWKTISYEAKIEDERSIPRVDATSNQRIVGKAGIVLNSETGETLFAKNEQERVYPASTTKILTALIAIERGNLEDVVTVGKEINMKQKGESTAFLYQGQEVTLRQLLAGLMLPSGNDAARTIAIYIANKEQKGLTESEAIAYFANLMNKKAEKVGAKHSHFVNPHGLHDKNHYTTAYDMAMIAQAAMENKEFRNIVGQEKYSDQSVTYKNRNKLLDHESGFYYEGANGIKTGFTDEAGYCLVSSATSNDMSLIAVVMNSTENDVWTDSTALLNGEINN
ncbi:D-alanyl-D-alanine carboxypeptidase family protein [Bacillus massiliigorillae]|uniref:D-alanyl-D-alanine carboxypeptidase family protein n=1 Tax=Bacillus massiliigorillae TaxID=1243664 RepID=UPI000694EFBE|nr:D-alanyl-D-alanine carboxypeptidase family protein [Bacillus massiliigorillae]